MPARENRLAGWLCIGVVMLALVLGGGTTAGFAGDAVAQLAAVALLALWIAAPRDRRTAGSHRFELLACIAIVLVPVAQLVPLPPEFWTRLPQYAAPHESLQAAGIAPGWRPLSLNGETTAVAA